MSEEPLSKELLDELGTPKTSTAVESEVSTAPAGSATLVDGIAADAVANPGAELSEQQRALVEEIVELLKDVIDPELGINIVDLGLLYGLHLDGDDLVIDMTLTSAGCPLTDMIERQCRFVLEDLVKTVSINWVWLPPWGPDKITQDGREQLRALGFNV